MDTEKETNVAAEDDEIQSAVEEAESEETPPTEEETSKPETANKEEEKPSPKSEKKSEEESVEAKVNRLAQSRSDKLMKPLKEENQQLKKQVNELSEKINEKSWDKDIADLFNEEKESLGEEDASKRKARREDLKKQVLEYNKNAGKVKDLMPALEAKQSALEMVERDQMARLDVWKLLFPEDKEKVEQVDAMVKKFAKAKDLDDYELVLEGIRESLNGKSKKFKADSGRVGGGGIDMSKLSPTEKINEGFKRMKKK